MDKEAKYSSWMNGYMYTHAHTLILIHTNSIYMYSFHTVEYYSAIKKNEFVPFGKTWME